MAGLEGKRIILGITGSIAAIKAPAIVRELKLAGASVTCAMTESAGLFVSIAEIETATGNSVITEIFSTTWKNHPPAPSFSAAPRRRGSSIKTSFGDVRGDAVW